MVAAGISEEVLVQVAYAIGVANPVSLNINTYGKSKIGMSDAEIAKKIEAIFDMRPKAIIERLGLRNPIFSDTAAYGHMGRAPYKKEVEVSYLETTTNGNAKEVIHKKENRTFEFFTWEKLDYVDKIKEAFGL